MKGWLVSLVFAVLSLGVAQTPAVVSGLLEDGKYLEAYEAGLKLNSAAGWILAAKSASFHATYVAKDNEKEGWFAKAEASARKAIQADADNSEAYMELARAQGRLAQYKGILESLNLASGIRDSIDKSLKYNPKNAGAKVALALWNHSLVSKGVGWLYGADGNRVVPLLLEAIALEPQTIIHKVEYAGILAAQNKKDEARKQYEAALALTPKTAADKYDQERAKRELAALK